jgi:hypothetical protein
MPGRPEFVAKTREPQIGQKCRVSVLPLSAVSAKLDVLPVTSTFAASNSAFDVCPAPDTRWQSRQ